MLIVRAPVRISFAGGGTDLPAYYERHGGFVVSTSIDKYFYVAVGTSMSDSSVQISSSDYRAFFRHRRGAEPLWDGDMGLVRATLHEFGFESGISLFLASEIPPGTGLGSSSTVAVALVKALATLRGMNLTAEEVANWACAIELGKLQSPIGKQDQYAAACGGINGITFTTDGVQVEPVRVSLETRARLQRSLLLFFTGGTRSANDILRKQSRASEDDKTDTVWALGQIKQAAFDTVRCLERGDIRAFGAILRDSWEMKKRLAPGVSTARIDELYALALKHGAVGGKLAGAGGGGFLMLFCEEGLQPAVIDALEAAGLYQMDYHFQEGGAQVLMNALPTTSWHRPQSTPWSYAHAR